MDTAFLAGGLGINFFWSCQIWGQKLFGIFSFTEHCVCSNFQRGVWAPNFFCHTKFEVKNISEFFHLQSTVDSEFFTGRGQGTNNCWSHQLFLVMPNLKPKSFSEFFNLESALDSEFFAGGIWAPTFFGHTKFEVKNFSEFFHWQCCGLWIFWQGGQGTNFLITSNLRSKIFWNFFHYQALWTLIFQRWVWANFFWSC